MLPIEHFIVALLPVVGYVLVRDRRLPTLQLVAIVFVGSQFPDLIDKPLAHQFQLLPNGRVFMHSLPIAVPFLCLVGLYGRKTERPRPAGAFAFAHLSHIVADNRRALLSSDPTVPSDMLWPLRPVIQRPMVPHWAGEGSINVHLWTAFAAVVLAISAYYLYVDVDDHLRGGRS
ncbi:metal-dependent hydrolase [Halorubrum sp. CBA1125]|uniref:metal-dependent hydrolase n=1 Tax=Halorubrum sp. CBA1125 TaxID=2668072 RepID=UPI00135E02C2|nr:metal-dependent hydrolase [Halorubrum sp. CBA1125]MUW13791.1 metal-dependent hydrolase [Halorubrum sp. CBA1125]